MPPSVKKVWLYVSQRMRSVFDSVSRKKYGWSADAGHGGMKKKEYGDYSEYVAHQKSKIPGGVKTSELSEYDEKYRLELRKRLEDGGIVRRGMSVLCLAARFGGEVRSFLDLGCFAVGIDLNPGAENKYVLYGDFHDLQFPDGSVDLVFSNSLDHAFDFGALLAELKRVLRPGGFVILEVVGGEGEGRPAGYFESVAWERIDDLLKLFTDAGFSVASRRSFEYPWPGDHVALKLK